MPVELIFLPTSFYFNIYEMSSWSRGTIVPLSMVCAHKPVYSLDEAHGAQEIFTEEDRDLSIKSKEPGVNWPNAFLMVDKFLKLCGKIPWKPFRRSAFKRAEKWVLKHQEPDGDFSGIQPAMLNSLLALHYQGYSNDHPAIVKGLEAVDRFLIETENDTCMQACISPLWDTAIACNALMDSGIPGDHQAIVAAVEWMLKKQITSYGDWKIKNPNTPPGGWSFEFYNENYPDTDDTAEILMAIQRTEIEDKEWKEKESQIAMTWLMSMQSANGGWGAFDQDNDHELFNKIPFADHGAMLDPPTADVTSRILWMLGRRNFSKTNPQVQKALQFVKSEQEDDGCWFGRWGVNYVYGTFLALTGLESMGEDMGQPSIRKAVEWLEQHQNEDGGWGETCQSYTDPSLRGQGKSTASQTAWAVIGLVSAGEAGGSSAKRGIEFLIREQKEDGSWWEDEFTGTGFPGHFYIKYHMYQHYFPLMALGRFKNATDKSS
jgi:squalene-hopene/tetraprenyl-beta-curcumene cyclase